MSRDPEDVAHTTFIRLEGTEDGTGESRLSHVLGDVAGPLGIGRQQRMLYMR